MTFFKTGTVNVTTFSSEEERASSVTNASQGFSEQPAHVPGIIPNYKFYYNIYIYT